MTLLLPSEEERKWGRELALLTQSLGDPNHGRPKLLELSSTQRLRTLGNGSELLEAPASHINTDGLQRWLGTHQAGLAKLVELQNEMAEDLAVLQELQL